MYSCGPPHMAVQKQDDQHERRFSNYVRIRDVVQKTCQRRWTIGKCGERGSGISMLPARHDDDDIYIYIYISCYQIILKLKFRSLDFSLVDTRPWYILINSLDTFWVKSFGETQACASTVSFILTRLAPNKGFFSFLNHKFFSRLTFGEILDSEINTTAQLQILSNKRLQWVFQWMKNLPE